MTAPLPMSSPSSVLPPPSSHCAFVSTRKTKTRLSKVLFFFFAQHPPPPQWARSSSFTRFLDHTQPRNTPLDEWSVRRRDLYMTTLNTHNRQTSMPPVGFEPTISAVERPLTYALNRAATGIGFLINIICFWRNSPQWARASSFRRFLDHTRHTTLA